LRFIFKNIYINKKNATKSPGHKACLPARQVPQNQKSSNQEHSLNSAQQTALLTTNYFLPTTSY
jgi:hypothetical protein